MKILHDSRKTDFRAPFGAAVTGSGITLSIEAEDPFIESVRLMLWKGEDPKPQYLEMKESGGGHDTGAAGEAIRRYTADIITPDEGCLLWYAFEIETGSEDDRHIFYYGNNESDLGGEGRVYISDPHRYQITVYKPAEVPEWYRNGIVYQIFPGTTVCRHD